MNPMKRIALALLSAGLLAPVSAQAAGTDPAAPPSPPSPVAPRAAASAPAAPAVPRPPRPVDVRGGVIDTAPFAALADDGEPAVEVYLRGDLLKTLSSAFKSEDPTVGGIVAGLEAVTAVVVDVSDARWHEAQALVRGVAAQLQQAENWQLIARVKDEGDNITVLAKSTPDKGIVNGVLVLVLSDEGKIDPDEDLDTKIKTPKALGERQLIFANIAGPIRLSDISKIGEALDLPGLDEVHVDSPGRGVGK